MTICCAVTDGTETHIACDTLASDESLPLNCFRQKFICREDQAIMFAGEGRVGNLLEKHEEGLLPATDVHDLVDRLTTMFLGEGFRHHSGEWSSPPLFNGELIWVESHQVWRIYANMAALEFGPGIMCAIGSGTQYALGADWNKECIGNDFRVINAVEAAIALEQTCGGRVIHHVLEAEDDEDEQVTVH
jgi:ATP-dependent protease HslVU (ClpYQ) peptidase subunit